MPGVVSPPAAGNAFSVVERNVAKNLPRGVVVELRLDALRHFLDLPQRWDEWGVWLWAPPWTRFVRLQRKAQNEVLLADNPGAALRIIDRKGGWARR
jgi:hypothetical protein